MKKLNSILLFPNHRILSLAMIAVTIGAGAVLATTGGTPKRETTLVASEWQTLQTKMDSLQATVNKPLPKIDLNALTQQMQALSKHLDEVRAQNAQHIDQALNQTEAALVSRLDTIQTLLHQLETKQMPVKYLASSHLPFRVLSLDSIQHVPVASVAYNFKTVPLEKGDALAGWRVVHIDYGKQRIEFENAQKERVLVAHEHMG